MFHLRTSLALALATMLLVACGSTVRPEGGADQATTSSDSGMTGLDVGGAPGTVTGGGTVSTSGAVTTGTPAAGRSGQPGASPSAGAPGAQAGGPATSASAVAPSGTSSPAGTGDGTAGPSTSGGTAASAPAAVDGTPTGRGFDETTVNLGVLRLDDPGPVLDMLGADIGETTIDPYAAFTAMVDDINAHGGLAGRQINLVTHSATTAEALFSPDTYSQAACATWTEDNDVFAVIGALDYEALIACLHNHDTPLIWTGGIDIPRHRYQYLYDRYPLYFHVGGMVGESYDRIAMRRLVERAYFEPWDTAAAGPASGPAAPPVKFGLVIEDNEEGERGIEHLTQVLAGLGQELHAVARISRGTGPGQFDNAALQFRSEGITHVQTYAAAFLTSANSQRYYPRLFLEQSLNSYALSSPPESMAGAMGASYLPAADTQGENYPGHPNPAAYEPCLAVVEEAGAHPSSVLDHYQVQAACDALYPLRDAIAATGALSNDAIRDGFTALGDRPVASITWTSQFSATQHASTTAVRDISFVSDCTCWSYDSDVNHFAD